MSADLTERLRRDSSGSVTSLDDRMRRASVQSVDSVRSDADWSALDAERAARLIARRVSLANVTRTRRQQEEEKGMGPEWTCETKNRRCRYATDHFLESDTVVGIFVLLVLIETAAGELSTPPPPRLPLPPAPRRASFKSVAKLMLGTRACARDLQ